MSARQVQLRPLLVGIEGLALLRRLLVGDDEEAAARIAEVQRLVDEAEAATFALSLAAPEVDVREGYAVWSATYDRPITELFTMQDEIVRAIIGALRVELLPEQQRELARHATTSAAAYDEYLLAMSVFKDDETSNRRSLAHYQRAVQLDPEFIDAWIGMADLLGHSGLYADDAAEALAGKRRSIEIIDHVIAIAPGRADAYLTRGIHRCAHWWDWSGAEQDFRAAIAANPRLLRRPPPQRLRLRRRSFHPRTKREP